jgi:formiminotetrahydrofolate cyclodeaminase
MNVQINCADLEDKTYVQRIKTDAQELVSKVEAEVQAIQDIVNQHLNA